MVVCHRRREQIPQHHQAFVVEEAVAQGEVDDHRRREMERPAGRQFQGHRRVGHALDRAADRPQRLLR